jgi:CBS domain-containing protein
MSGILDARPRVGYYYCGKSSKNLLADELKQVKVNEIKSRPVVIKENLSVYDAIVTMFMDDVGSLFVLDDNSFLIGLVSRKDLLRQALGQGDLHKMPVNIIMTRMPNLVTVETTETVYEAAKKIIEHEIDALPVVKKHTFEAGRIAYEVIGRITKTGITRLFVSLIEGV